MLWVRDRAVAVKARIMELKSLVKAKAKMVKASAAGAAWGNAEAQAALELNTADLARDEAELADLLAEQAAAEAA